MHVANHALRSRNAAGELMPDRMTRFIFGNAGIAALRAPEISRSVVESGMSRVAIVRVNHVTSSAARRSIIAGMIVSPKKIQCRIEQPRLLQSEINWISSLRRSQ